jgi:hypothetical protein
MGKNKVQIGPWKERKLRFPRKTENVNFLKDDAFFEKKLLLKELRSLQERRDFVDINRA